MIGRLGASAVTSRRWGLASGVGLWIAWLAAARLLQLLLAAPQSPFTSYPDSPAHYVSGLLVREYLLAGLPADPLGFAEGFYLHYPLVAIGNWPPGYHLVEALWGLVFSPTPASMLWLQAAALATAATIACRLLSPEIGSLGAAVAAGLLLVSAPAQIVSSGMMAEPLTAALSLGAAAAYLRYLERPGAAPAGVFGLLAGCALLTKGVAISLALLPLSALACGRAGLVKRWDFWAPAVIVLAVAGPWYLGAEHLAGFGEGFRFSAEQTIRRHSLDWIDPFSFVRKANGIATLLGWGMAGLAMLGLAVRFFLPALRRTLTPRAAVIGIFVSATLVVHLALRYANEPRHALHALPLAIGYAFAGALWAVERSGLGGFGRGRAIAAGFVCVLASGGVRLHKPPVRGLRVAAEAIRADSGLDEAVILVSSQAGGEGIFVAEMAALEPSPKRVILRGSKVLADSGWATRRYEVRYGTAVEVADYLDSIPVSVVVVDLAPGDPRVAHHKLVLDALASRPEDWRRIDSNTTAVRVYGATRPDLRQRGPIRVDLTRRTGNVLELPPPQEEGER